MQRRSVLGAAAALAGGIAAYLAAMPFIRSLRPSARAEALGEPIEIDLSVIRPGEVRPYAYRGRTILVLRRTPEMIGKLAAMTDRLIDSDPVGDPEYVENEARSIEKEILVVEGVCTHLGCVPRLISAEAGREAAGDWWAGGFWCPCHDSAYDYAGRVVKGPAPHNLRIPPHRYVSASRVIVGEESPPT